MYKDLSLLALLTAYKAEKARIDEREKELESMKEEIIARMNGQETVVCGQYKAENKPVSRTTIDGKSLRADMPEVADKYEKTTVYNRFTVR